MENAGKFALNKNVQNEKKKHLAKMMAMAFLWI